MKITTSAQAIAWLVHTNLGCSEVGINIVLDADIDTDDFSQKDHIAALIDDAYDKIEGKPQVVDEQCP